MNSSAPKLSIEALRTYVPLFQMAEAAEAEIENNASDLTEAEIVRLRSLISLKDQSVQRIADLAEPLMRRVIGKLFKGSHLANEMNDLYNTVYYAGIGGMEKGLRKFEVEKIDKSATNYLFQWIETYAKKELLVHESPMGIAPSRFQRHKKISAVRKKLSEILARPASNNEILDYFHEGRAELKRLDGPKNKKEGVSNANLSITIDLIEEQEEIEKNLQFAQFFSDDEEFRTEQLLAIAGSSSFEDSLFGNYIYGKAFNLEAIAVLKSELQYSLTNEETELIEKQENSRYRDFVNSWMNYMGDPSGDFAKFVESNLDSGFDEVNLLNIQKFFTDSKRTDNRRTKILFEKDVKGK